MRKLSVPFAGRSRRRRVHDNFFRDVFGVVEYAVRLFRLGLRGTPLCELIDWTKLQLAPRAIQADRHGERVVDLAFLAQTKVSGSKLLLLIEHKSFHDSKLVEQIASAQFLGYMGRGFEMPIVTIVVFQGVSKNRELVRFSDQFAKRLPPSELEILARHAFEFESPAISVDRIDRERLAAGSMIDAPIRAMAKARRFEAEDLQDMLARLRHVPKGDQVRMSALIFGYISDCNARIRPEHILGLQAETKEEQQMVQSAVDYFREEGRVEGRVEGLEAGRQESRMEVAAKMLRKGMASADIVEITDLSKKQVEKLRRKINGVAGS